MDTPQNDLNAMAGHLDEPSSFFAAGAEFKAQCKNFVDGCLARALAVACSGIYFDQACNALEESTRDGMPNEYATILRELSSLKMEGFLKTVDYIQRNIRPLQSREAWRVIRDGASKSESEYYNSFIRFVYNGAPPPGNTAADHIVTARQKLCTLSNIKEENFDNYRDQAHLPTAIIQAFDLGALLFLPDSREPYRQIYTSRTALYDIFRILADADHENVLEQDPNVMQQLKPTAPLFAAMDVLKQAREGNHIEAMSDSDVEMGDGSDGI
ncbi:hypothetical protein B0H67DRAFT_643474 [Lasiosphaeris hirsuta]|uniref:Uncharacterized protein n=1 Tax=Lasiosphaeris hirsuta TaxID=260670 RepID=A0AA40AQQ6_9PEZI|nr:hypothetical protein B0H67DRAFT_643474 [Lasiosphaeris hirsuta]